MESHKRAFRSLIANVENRANDFTDFLQIIYKEIERLEEQHQELQKSANPLEMIRIPVGKFMMGSTAAEKAWATGIEGGAQPGTDRE